MQYHELEPCVAAHRAGVAKPFFQRIAESVQDFVPEIEAKLFIVGIKVVDHNMHTDKICAPHIIFITEHDRFLTQAAGIEQSRKQVPAGDLRAPSVIDGQQLPVNKKAKQTLNLAVTVIQRSFTGQDFLVLPSFMQRPGMK